ncbi:MAG TPA: class I SAM-dependent methyltransferase [Longimicrobiaceae bacterium]|nr:class I SAM-dependent methyltransferase [Longimicrobiaceae bacterium]
MDASLAAVHASAEGRHWWFRARRRIVAGLAARVLPTGRRARVVDVGCGTGATAASFADAHDVVGVDASPDSVAQARARFPGVRFVLGDGPHALPPSEGDIDLVLIMDVLEHVEDDRALLEPWLRRLKPGAHLILTVPGEMRLWSPHDVRMGHYRRYERDSLDRLLAGMPAEVLLVSPFNTRLHPLVRAARWVASARGRGLAAAGTDVFVPPAPVNSVLERVFGGEAERLQRALDGRAAPYPRGVSWVAVLRRTDEPARG